MKKSFLFVSGSGGATPQPHPHSSPTTKNTYFLLCLPIIKPAKQKEKEYKRDLRYLPRGFIPRHIITLGFRVHNTLSFVD